MQSKSYPFVLSLLAAMLAILFSFSGQAQLANVGPVTVSTDKDDYAPRSNAVFTGTGFLPGEDIILKVKNLSRPCNTVTADSSYLPWTVTADGSGNFVTNWTVCDCVGDSLRLKVVGQTSGYIGYAYFTDGKNDYTSTLSSQSVCSGGSFTLTLSNISDGSGGSNKAFQSFLLKVPAGVTVSSSSVNQPNWTYTSTPGQIRYSTSSNSITKGNSIVVTLNVSVSSSTSATWETNVFTANNWTASGSSPEFLLTDNSNAQIFVYPSNTISPQPSSGALAKSPNVGAVCSGTSVSATASTGTGGIGTIADVVEYRFDGAGSWAAYSSGTNLSTTGHTLVEVRTYRTATGSGCNQSTPTVASWSVNPTPSAPTIADQSFLTIENATVASLPNVGGSYKWYATASSTPALANTIALSAGQYYVTTTLGTCESPRAGVNVSINKAQPIITWEPAGTIIYGTTLNGKLNAVAKFNNVEIAGTYTYKQGLDNVANSTLFTYAPSPYSLNVTFTPSDNDNYESASEANTIIVNKRAITITADAKNKTYGDTDPGLTYQITTGSLVAGDGFTGSLQRAAGETVGSYAISQGAVALNNNYNLTYEGANLSIAQANAIINVIGFSGTFDGNAYGATGTAKGMKGEELSNLLDLGAAYTDVPGGSVNWSFAGDANHKPSTGSVAITISKAPNTISFSALTTKTYGNADFTLNATSSTGLPILYTASGNATVSGNTVHITGAGFAIITAHQAGSNNYEAATSVSQAFTINKANALINVSGYTNTYDGNAHGASGTATGVFDEDLTNFLTLGDSYTDYPGGIAGWSFAGNENYNEANGEVQIQINKATPTITLVIGTAPIYNAQVHYIQSATISGVVVNGVFEDLGTATVVYKQGGASIANPVDAGDYDVIASFSGNNNYEAATSRSGTFQIKKADAIITITDYEDVYDGQAHTASGTATGVNGANLIAGLQFATSYADPPGGTTAWAFDGGTNYNSQDGTANVKIAKAKQAISWNTPDKIVYGTLLSATQLNATSSGIVGGSAAGALSYNVNIGDRLNAGLHQLTVIAGATTNYEEATKTVTLQVDKATQTITWVTPGAIAYPAALSATQLNASVSGVAGGSAAGQLTYAPAIGAVLNAGSQTLTVTAAETENYNEATATVSLQVDKGTPQINWTTPAGITYGTVLSDGQLNATSGVAGTFSYQPAAGTLLEAGHEQELAVIFTPTDANNYNGSSTSVKINVAKANATIDVSGYSGVYNGQAHGATGTVKGINNIALVGLDLGASFTDAPGGTANWTFDGGKNYNSTSGSVAITIAKANAVINVTGYSVTYNGEAHTASGSAKGVESVPVDLSGLLTLSGTTHTNAGIYQADAWSFAGNNNYNADQGTVDNTIAKASSVTAITITGAPFTYTGAAITPASVSITGVGGLNLTPAATYQNNINAGTATVSYTFAGDDNHLGSSATETFAIGKATATIAVNTYNVTYNGNEYTATGSATGVQGESLSGLDLSNTTHTNAGNYTTDTWSFTDATGNYKDVAATTVTNNIAKANPVIAVQGYNGFYDGNVHGASGAAKGVKEEDLSNLLNLGATFTDAPGGTASWNFAGNSNYNVASGTAAIEIAQRHITVTPDALSKTYGGTDPDFSYTPSEVLLSGNSFTGALSRVAGENAGQYSYTIGSLSAGSNYIVTIAATNSDQFTAAVNPNQFTINRKDASVTPSAANKYCGQEDPTFTGILSGFLANDNVSATYSVSNNSITATLSPDNVLNNYNITYYPAAFTINGVSIDASASGTPVPIGTTTIMLSASVAPKVKGVKIIFKFEGAEKGYAFTNDQGVAALTIQTPSLVTNVYPVEAMIAGGCATPALAYIPAYDPNAGFVTGGGWINSPVGAYQAETTATGKANFGFVAKYKKGSTTLEGETEFQFQAGNLKFNSTSYEAATLVISTFKASYRGVGTINGMGKYKFTLTAIDGQVTGGGGTDKIRMKIVDYVTGALVYDNQKASLDNEAPTTELGGGSIVIHEAKAGKQTAQLASTQEMEIEATVEFGLKAFPNPTTSQFNIKLESNNYTDPITLRISDLSGRLVRLLPGLTAGQTILLGNEYKPGVYFIEMIQGSNRKQLKLLKQPN